MNAFVVISKYFMMLLVACFVFFSLLGNTMEGKNKKEKFVNIFQWGIMLVFHFTGFLVLTVEYSNKYIIFYGISLVVIIVMAFLYNYVYKELSKSLFNNMIMLIIIGMIILARLDFAGCVRQFVFISITLFVGLFVPYIIARVKILDKLSIIYGATGITLLTAVLFLGTARNGAKNWLVIGPVVLQPSEFVKVLYVFAIAGFLAKGRSFKRIFITGVVAAAHVLILVAEKDLGGALLFFVTFLVMVYIGTNKKAYLFCGLGALCVMCVIAYNLFSHIRVRVLAYMDPFAVIDREGYQLAQSFFAIGNGGLFGTGLSRGYPESIPVVSSDFVFSAISEEMGGIVAIGIMLIYMSFFVAFINIAVKMKSVFYKLIACGITVMFMVQVILNLGGVTGFIPSTGVTLPLISQGGSSVITIIIMISIIQGLYSINFENKAHRGEKI